MSKYEPLNQFLSRLQADYWRPTFLELERILEFKLPAAARKSAGWWEKDSGVSRHAHAWTDAGWKVESVDVEKERVTFTRAEGAAAAASTRTKNVPRNRRAARRRINRTPCAQSIVQRGDVGKMAGA